MQKFRKRPVVIEAVQWDGGEPSNYLIHEVRVTPAGEWGSDRRLVIPTLEGDMICQVGDWIIKGIQGEFYPIKPEIFEATYESLEAPPAEGQSDAN